MDRSDAEAVVLTHLPRQLPVSRVKQIVLHALPRRHHERLVLLMDHVASPPDSAPLAKGNTPPPPPTTRLPTPTVAPLADLIAQRTATTTIDPAAQPRVRSVRHSHPPPPDASTYPCR